MSMALIESHSRPSPTATSSVVVPVPAYEPAQFFDFARDLFCVAGLDGYFKLVNASWERVLGYSREELMSRAFLDFVHPDDPPSEFVVLAPEWENSLEAVERRCYYLNGQSDYF